MQSRYYNPDWGRFVNADAIVGQTGELLGHNMFAYCKNNPVSRHDPSGLLSSPLRGFLDVIQESFQRRKENKKMKKNRAIIHAAPKLVDRVATNQQSFNCFGNAIGMIGWLSPSGYKKGMSSAEIFDLVLKDLGAENITIKNSARDSIGENQVLIALKGGPESFHFMVRDGGVWYNKSGSYPVIVNEDLYFVEAQVWYFRTVGQYGPYTSTSVYYDDDTIYFALNNNWR